LSITIFPYTTLFRSRIFYSKKQNDNNKLSKPYRHLITNGLTFTMDYFNFAMIYLYTFVCMNLELARRKFTIFSEMELPCILLSTCSNASDYHFIGRITKQLSSMRFHLNNPFSSPSHKK